MDLIKVIVGEDWMWGGRVFPSLGAAIERACYRENMVITSFEA